MSANNQMFLKHKIVFLGDQSVGKTSIILRFSQDTYDGKQKVSVSCIIRIVFDRRLLALIS